MDVRKRLRTMPAILSVSMVIVCAPSLAAVGEDEAALLGITGTPLTPLGATRAGNEEGTIPRWEGGYEGIPDGFQPGGEYIDPFSQDQVLFTITAKNYEQYRDKLTEGQIATFKRYPDTYFMNVYPSRRTASFPLHVYEGTIKAARTAERCGERCLSRSTIPDGGGIPFPIPKNGDDVVFNGNFFFMPPYSTTGTAIVTAPDGGYVLNVLTALTVYPYWLKEAELPSEYFRMNGGAQWCNYGANIAPPRAAGQLLNFCTWNEHLELAAYVYIPGQRRVRKAPEVGFYDQPAQGSDGLMTSQERNGFYISGKEEWFDHVLLGKEEKIVPYNNYGMMAASVGPKDIIRAGHMNPEHVRYELHRVWVVESKVKEQYRNIMPHHKIYYDEDSWRNVLATRWNQNGDIWRANESFLVHLYDAKATWPVAVVSNDLIAGRWASLSDAFVNWNGGIKFISPQELDWNFFTPQGLRSAGRR